jgi:hypothetical protein
MDPSTAPQNLLQTFERLLAALDRVLERPSAPETTSCWNGRA